MTTSPRDDQARDRNDILSDLQHTVWAFQGLGEVMDPDASLGDGARGNVAILIRILAERFETLLGEVEHRWRSRPAATPAPKETQP